MLLTQWGTFWPLPSAVVPTFIFHRHGQSTLAWSPQGIIFSYAACSFFRLSPKLWGWVTLVSSAYHGICWFLTACSAFFSTRNEILSRTKELNQQALLSAWASFTVPHGSFMENFICFSAGQQLQYYWLQCEELARYRWRMTVHLLPASLPTQLYGMTYTSYCRLAHHHCL